MKTKILITLTALCVSGLFVPAMAQTMTNAPDDNSGAAAPDQSGMQPDGTDVGNQPNDNGMVPPDTTTPDQTPDQNGATTDQTTTDQTGTSPGQSETMPAETSSTAVPPAVILPKGSAPQALPANFAPPAQAADTNGGQLRMNFQNAPLDEVLNYLSDAAGFIIVLDTRVSGTVSIMSAHPVTQDEAVDLLNTELNRNGYAAIRDGRTLTIVNKSDAKMRNIPVKTGNDPNAIPDNDEIATWIIPIRFVDAQQLVSDLSPFVSAQATVVANEAGNSIVVTDTQANIRHLVEIIQAVDNSAETETEVRVFRLKYANPTDVATELGSIFPSSGTSGNNAQAPIRFGGGGGGRGGFFARIMANGAGGGGNDAQSQRIQKATQVTAVADARLQAVIVSAPQDLMDQIAGMMTALDVPSDRDQQVYVYHLEHGDPNEVAQVLQSAFGGNSSSRVGSTSQQDALQTRETAGAQAAGNNQSATSSSGIGSSPGGSRGGGVIQF
ncbi:MAG TPA: secretin N-terminal domain-containing protein [Verrucomicrobiae bacterium]|nr:secretin N-terminal domain-containing protein [Verrucomicrobiae bacterium]